jgi:hypothetical protein
VVSKAKGLIFSVSEEDIRMLQEGQPIMIPLEEVGGDGTVVISELSEEEIRRIRQGEPFSLHIEEGGRQGTVVILHESYLKIVEGTIHPGRRAD